jgi:uncharacterized membrane protein YfcA
VNSLGEAVLLAGAGVLAGAVNALAGGGTLISFPALLAAGYPPLTATVTSTVALWPGYLGGAVGYRRELSGQRRLALSLAGASAAGAVAGAVLLLSTSAAVFESLVPVLIAVASVALLVQPWLKARFGLGKEDKESKEGGDGEARGHSRWAYLGVGLGGVYGAYFSGGMGVLLLGVLGLFVHDHLQRVNAVRAVLSLVINTVAVVAYALFGPVHWPAVAIMAVASLAGGLGGTRVARRLPPPVLRGVVVTFGLVLSVVLAVR